MNAEKQRIAIAGACGTDLWQNRPNYLNDLNACHEMEKVLTKDDYADYVSQLIALCDNCDDFLTNQSVFVLIHATAPQRAEAFLRAIGKWEPAPHD